MFQPSFKVVLRMTTLLILALSPVLSGCGGTSAVGKISIFYPPPPQSPRIQYLARFQNSTDVGVEGGRFRKFVTGEGTELEALQKPHFAIWSDGRIYVCDTRSGEIVIMDLENHKYRIMGKEEGFKFGKPLGIAIAADGTRFIADNINKRVYSFDQNDRFLRTYGHEGQFGPTSVAVHGNRIFVADTQDKEVEILDRTTGEVIRAFTGSKEVATGVFRMPANIAVDNKGYLYVSDLLAGNVQVFDQDLEYIRTIGRLGDQLGTFGRPRGVAVDDHEVVFVADAAFENVQAFDSEGVPLIFFGGPGVNPGQMYMPAGITLNKGAVDYFKSFTDDRFELESVILVTNQFGPNGVTVYGLGHGVEGYFDTDVRTAPQAIPGADDDQGEDQ